jgi:hypothetical protein
MHFYYKNIIYFEWHEIIISFIQNDFT